MRKKVTQNRWITLYSILIAYVMFGGGIVKMNAQCMQQKVAFDYVPARSAVIVEGTVIDQEAKFEAGRNQIVTDHTISINQRIKGDVSNSTIIIRTLGGRIGDQWHTVMPEVHLSLDDEGIFMVNPIKEEPNTYSLWAVDQSWYKYDRSQNLIFDAFRTFPLQSKERLVEDILRKSKSAPQEVHQKIENTDTRSLPVTSFSPTTVTAGTNTILTINGSGFGNNQGTLYFRNQNTTSNSYVSCPSSNIESWSSSQITVRVPRNAGTGRIWVQATNGSNHFSSSDLTVTYSISSFDDAPTNTPVRYVAPETNGEVEFRLNNSFASNTNASNSFLRAIDTWICDIGIHLVQGSNTSINTFGNDNVSVIRWSSGSGGDIVYPTLGRYNGYFFACSQNPEEWYADEFDIQFIQDGTGVDWEYGPQLPSSSETDFETVALHEVGHAMILGHVLNESAVMHPVVIGNSVNRDIGAPGNLGGLYSMPLHQGDNIQCNGWHPVSELPPLVVTISNGSGSGSLPAILATACPGATITFSPSLSGSTIVINTPIVIDKEVVIEGLGTNNLTLSGNNANRIFEVTTDGMATIKNLKLINGYHPTIGGAILNEGELTLDNLLFENNFEGTTKKAFSNEGNGTVQVRSFVDIKE